MTLAIVTNSQMCATRQRDEWIRQGRKLRGIAVISRTDKLLCLPEQTGIIILDYRTGRNPECVCEVARLMVGRGDFVEVIL